MAVPPFSIVGIDHLVLRVSDLARSLEFYQQVLGCTLERELPDLGLYQLRAGNQLIDLVLVGTKLGGQSSPKGSPNQDHFCLTVDPFSESQLQAHLTSHGIKQSAIGERYGAEGFGPSVYISDPDDNVVELKAASRS